MPTDLNNQVNGAQSPATPVASNSGSPWEDELDLPEAPPKSEPTVIGSLDPKSDAKAEEATPFNVPNNIEEKVGQKVSAETYMAPKEEVASPASSTPLNTGPAQSTGASASAAPQAASASISNAIQKAPAAPLPQATAPLSTGENVVPASANVPSQGKSKKNIFSIFKFGKKNQTNKVFSNKGLLPEQKESQLAPAKDLAPKKSFALLNNKRVVPVLGVLVFFVFLIGLTELGLLSLGVERIYGAIGMERIWGGLSNDPLRSFARSAVEMQKHPNIKIKGTITMSVDSSIESQITSPLLSAALQQNHYAKRDVDNSVPIKAIQTATSSDGDVYNLYDNSSSSESSSPTLDSSSSSNSSNTGDLDSSSSVDTGSNAIDELSSAFVEEVSSIEEVKASFKTKSNKEGLETNINIDSASESSNIDLLFKNGNLLVNSSAYNFSANAEPDKWLSYNLAKLEGKSLQNEFFSINSGSGISIKGKRTANEKVVGARCYRYGIDSMELANSLSSIGITSDMVQSISGNIWIGINDKLIHKAELKIITPVSSSVSSFSISLEFYDFDLDNKINFPDDTEVVEASGSNSSAEGIADGLDSRDYQRKNDVAKLLSALKLYKDENGSYPISNELLKLNASENNIEKALVPKYLSEWPSDPMEGWYYAYKSDGKKCSISARLENSSDSEGQMIGEVFLFLKYNNE